MIYGEGSRTKQRLIFTKTNEDDYTKHNHAVLDNGDAACFHFPMHPDASREA